MLSNIKKNINYNKLYSSLYYQNKLDIKYSIKDKYNNQITDSDNNQIIDSDNESINSNKEYIFKTNVNKPLSELLGIKEFNYDKNFYWKQPDKHGLSNSDYIIKPYYKYDKYPDKILNINYLDIIKDDIRNIRVLNNYQLE